MRLKLRRFLEQQYDQFVERPFMLQHIRLLEREVLKDCRTLLDIGCGEGYHLEAIKNSLAFSIGIDSFLPSLHIARDQKRYTHTIQMNANLVENAFYNTVFDAVVAFDLIEHLSKSEGNALLKAMERISRKKIIVFTPNGYLHQSALGGNPFQIHRSGWTAAEMRARGYEVTGVHGIKPLLGEASIPKFRPKKFWKIISVLTQALCLRLPQISFQIFCVKNIEKND